MAIDPRVERFLDSIRNAYFAGLAPNITAADILNILDDWQLRANVVGALRDRNDQELRRFVLEFLEELAAGLDHLADSDENWVELLDRAGFPVGGGLLLAGAAALAGVGATLGPLALILGGIVGMGACSISRFVLKRRRNRNRANGERIKRFVASIRSAQ